jgi:hypothetical protein
MPKTSSASAAQPLRFDRRASKDGLEHLISCHLRSFIALFLQTISWFTHSCRVQSATHIVDAVEGRKMWTLKIAILAAGVTVTAFAANSSPYSARCVAADEAAAGMTSGKLAEANTAAHERANEGRDCPARG